MKKATTTTFAARMPLLWLRGFLLASCWIIVKSSPTPGSEGHGAAPDCPSCALAALPKDVPNSQPEMVEAVKKHILNMLHLKKRPEVTQPVPKAALLNAIRKLHVGKVGENGYVEIEDDIGRRAEMNELMEQTSEIITFAESGRCGRSRLGAARPGPAGEELAPAAAAGRPGEVTRRRAPAAAAAGGEAGERAAPARDSSPSPGRGRLARTC